MPKIEIDTALLSTVLEHTRYSPRGGDKTKDRHSEKLFWSNKIKALRIQLNCSQKEFAEKYGIELRTLQNWEQAERLPDNSSRSLLTLVEKDPEVVRKTLSEARQRAPEMAE